MPYNNSEAIEYNLSRTSRKNINITIKNDGFIYVSAPKKVALADINKIIFSKKEWILNAQKNIKSKKTIKNNSSFRNNSSFYLYGELMKLRIFPDTKNYLFINIENKEVVFFVKEKYINDQKYKTSTLNKLLKSELKTLITKYSNKYLKNLSLCLSELEIRTMKTRWGTCIPAKKKILFNFNLIHCPKECIEYVVLHEIAHLIHPNHSKKFYNTIELHMKDWKERKNKLQSFVIV